MEIATRRREQEVWQACDDLWALYGAMSSLTGEAIREQLLTLGKSRGSPNEIYKYRKTWIKSRGVDIHRHMSDETSSDPITRAVKLVHEQLKNETDDHIAKLELEFEQIIKQKDDDIEKNKAALDAVMVEFNELSHRLGEYRTQQKSLEIALEAEIEVRKASERELLMIKTIREQEKVERERMLLEMRTAHLNEIAHLDSQEKAREERQTLLIERLEAEKQQLGFEYSERLTELKTVIYNNDLLAKQTEKKLADAHTEINRLLTHIDAKQKQIDMLKQENGQISSALSATSAELRMLYEDKKTTAQELKRSAVLLKKSEITVARLRAFIK